jgi:hypothetical protein
MYHTRNKTPHEDLQQGKKTARTQEEIILELFKNNPRKAFTPFCVLDELATRLDKFKHVPITSVRRALTDLTKAGLLYKDTDDQLEGDYGKFNCTWKYADPKVTNPSLFDYEQTLK